MKIFPEPYKTSGNVFCLVWIFIHRNAKHTQSRLPPRWPESWMTAAASWSPEVIGQAFTRDTNKFLPGQMFAVLFIRSLFVVYFIRISARSSSFKPTCRKTTGRGSRKQRQIPGSKRSVRSVCDKIVAWSYRLRSVKPCHSWLLKKDYVSHLSRCAQQNKLPYKITWARAFAPGGKWWMNLVFICTFRPGK